MSSQVSPNALQPRLFSAVQILPRPLPILLAIDTKEQDRLPSPLDAVFLRKLECRVGQFHRLESLQKWSERIGRFQIQTET